MLEYDSRQNVLMQSKYHYSLQDVEEPNLYREIYDYESVPKVAFNMRHVPMDMPDEIWITDTTFRDGQQSVSPFTPEKILHLYDSQIRLRAVDRSQHSPGEAFFLAEAEIFFRPLDAAFVLFGILPAHQGVIVMGSGVND